MHSTSYLLCYQLKRAVYCADVKLGYPKLQLRVCSRCAGFARSSTNGVAQFVKEVRGELLCKEQVHPARNYVAMRSLPCS